MKRSWSRVIVVVAAFAAGAVISGAAVQANRVSETTGRAMNGGLQAFDERVAAYAELHRRVDSVFPAWAPADAQTLVRRRDSLGSAIRGEREQAKQGDIFAAADGELRDIIGEALRGVDVDLLLVDLYEGCEMPASYRPEVNAAYPDWATHQMPVALLLRLPVLPAGIYYRLIDHDLLLWDADADVIIDVLPEALPRAGS